MKFFPTKTDDEFHEALIEYNVELILRMEASVHVVLDATEHGTETSPWRFGEPTSDFSGTTITLEKNVFDVSDAEYKKDGDDFFGDVDRTYLSALILAALGATAAYLFFTRRSDEIL